MNSIKGEVIEIEIKICIYICLIDPGSEISMINKNDNEINKNLNNKIMVLPVSNLVVVGVTGH